jgi:CubicO group peptidase (beta-lactamase class C family)
MKFFAVFKQIKIMKYLFIFLFLGITSSHSAQENFNPEKKILELSGKSKNIGMTAGYSINGEIKWSVSAGYNCSDKELDFSSTTLTRIASISKSFTAVAVMQLVEKNLIALDSPIENYLTNLPSDKTQITVRQLLAYTSGIGHYLNNNKEGEVNEHYESLEQAINVFIDRPLLFESGTEYHYNSYGYVLLGRIIEIASKKNYKDYMKKNIFEIANMKNTEYENTSKEYSNKSCLYRNKRNKTKEIKGKDLSVTLPAGGFISTSEDLLKFGNAILEEKLISKVSLNEMLEIQPVEYKGTNEYGLGWFVYRKKKEDGQLLFGHSGSQIGCSSQIMIAPDTKTVVVVLSNTEGTYADIGEYSLKLLEHSKSEKK